MEPILLITGASKGIGYATALNFQLQGWKIINISRTKSPIEGVINISLDLADPEFASKLKEQLAGFLKQKALICTVHNAAYHFKDSICNQDPEELLKSFTVSILSASIINQLVIPLMQEGSSILYVGSTLSEKAVPNTATYSTIKHANVGMMRATCQDLAKKKIHTACICPGFTNTDMLKQHLNNDDSQLALVKQKVSFERLIEPQEIAELIYFAAEHPLINGSVLHANLGQLET